MSRAEICGIRDGKGLEYTPWQTLNDATDKEHLKTSREEGNEDGGSHENHAADHCLLVTNPLGDIAVDNET